MENQTRLRKPLRTQVTTTLDGGIWSLAQQNNISWSVALERGVYDCLLEKGIVDIAELPTNYSFLTKEVRRLKLEKVEIMQNQEQPEKVRVTQEEAGAEANDVLNELKPENEEE